MKKLLMLLSLAGCAHVAAPDLPNRGVPPASDRHAAIAARYAPVIRQAIDPCGGRQDVFSNVDFDGDLVGRNNWENLDRHRLRPTVYYAVLETETHWFLAFHLFHPRDWNHLTPWLNDTHENDGENLALVVRKSDGRPILLWTQAHYLGTVHREFELEGRRPVVYVEAQGHGIHGAPVCGRTIAFRPGEAAEPALDAADAFYELSATAALWRPDLVGDGRLLDGVWRYRSERLGLDVAVPRFYDADRTSGPFGSDRAISPFALGRWCEGELGGLFFDPAAWYVTELRDLAAAEPWAMTYIDYPFTGAHQKSILKIGVPELPPRIARAKSP